MYPDHGPSTLRNAAYDVIVVGARAAGAATAMLLARRGVRTLLLDQSSPGSDTLSTHALMRGGVLQLSRWGLLDEIVAAGTPPVKRTTFSHGEERIVISIKPSHGVDALYAPRRTVLDPVLVDAAIDAGVDVYHRTSVTDLITRRGRVAGVHATTADGRSVELSATLVIGADGIRSTIARRAGATVTRQGEHASAATYAYWSDLATDGYEWIFRPNACCGVIPTNDGKACVFASASVDRIRRGGVALINDVVSESAPEVADRLRAASPPEGARTWSGRSGYLRKAHGPGWALVGDAGYFKDPIGAHGITDALRDAELLARAVVEGLDGDSVLDDALAQYEATRDRLSIPLFDVVDRIASLRWEDAEIADLLLQLSSSMTDEVETLAALDSVAVS
ncbi:MAG: NAD(P)/FAD-dependent oxidoreductase [Acidimicrobiia bacterium]